MLYHIRVIQLVDDSELDENDYNVVGEYEFEGKSKEHALNLFHGSVPISCVDCFEIEIVGSLKSLDWLSRICGE